MRLCHNCHGAGHLYRHPLTWKPCSTCGTLGVKNAGKPVAIIGPGSRNNEVRKS